MRLVGALILALCSAHPALACIVMHPQTFDVFRQADVVIRAKIVGYEAQPVRQDAVFRFDVVEMLSAGSGINKLSARWQNSTYGVPQRWDGSKNVIVGLRVATKPEGGPVMLVVQQNCGPISILEDTPANLERVRQARE